jgi:hypothetical protein
LHYNRKCFYHIKEDLQFSYSIYGMGKGLNMRIFTAVFRHTIINHEAVMERKYRQHFD